MGYLLRGAAAWLLIAVAETVHGVLRGLTLVPRVGDLASRQIGVFTGSALIVLIAFGVVRWIGAARRWQLLAVGAVWVMLMVGFELVVGRLFGFTWQRIRSDYDPTQGGLMLLGMCALLLAPLLASRLRTGAWPP